MCACRGGEGGGCGAYSEDRVLAPHVRTDRAGEDDASRHADRRMQVAFRQCLEDEERAVHRTLRVVFVVQRRETEDACQEHAYGQTLEHIDAVQEWPHVFIDKTTAMATARAYQRRALVVHQELVQRALVQIEPVLHTLQCPVREVEHFGVVRPQQNQLVRLDAQVDENARYGADLARPLVLSQRCRVNLAAKRTGK